MDTDKPKLTQKFFKRIGRKYEDCLPTYMTEREIARRFNMKRSTARNFYLAALGKLIFGIQKTTNFEQQ